MSVDYEANYGVGYEVHESDQISDIEELEYGLEEYIQCNVVDDFKCFVTGSAYTGEMTGIYLAIKNPFKDGFDLTGAKERLDKELKRLKLEASGDFGEIGGLYIY